MGAGPVGSGAIYPKAPLGCLIRYLQYSNEIYVY